MAYYVAVASTDGKSINCHFAKATQFFIYDLQEDTFEFITVRKTTISYRGNQEDVLAETADLLADCQLLIVSQIGAHAVAALQNRGIQAIDFSGPVVTAFTRIIRTRKNKVQREQQTAGKVR